MFAILFALMQIGNPQDYEKKIKDKRMAPPVCPANAHEQSFYFVITSYYRANRMKLVLCAIRSSWRRHLFRLVLLMMFVVLVRRKEGAGKFIQLNKEIYNYRRCG